MENLLSKEGRITRLRRNEKLRPECSYILSSESISKTLYFESKRDIIFAHKLIRRHLRNILDVVSYLFTPEGWVMIVCIKDEESIHNYLLQKRKKRAGYSFDISREISEHLRYMISGLAKAINARTGRKGTLVSRTFSRYICSDVETASEVIVKLENAEYSLSRQKRRYRASLRHWDVEGEFQGKAMVYLCSGGRMRGAESPILLALDVLSQNVLHRNLLNSIFQHLQVKKTKKHPNTTPIPKPNS